MQCALGTQLLWAVAHAGVGSGDTAIFELFMLNK